MAVSASWTHCTSSEDLRRSSHTVDIINRTAYVFGGELLPRQPRDNKVFKIDVHNRDHNVSELMLKSRVPPSRVGSASTVLNGKIYLFSGRGGEAMAPIEEHGGLWEFDPSNGAWSLLAPASTSAPFPQPRSYHCMVSDGSGLIYIHGGCPASGRLSDLWSFNVDTRSWTQHADAPAPSRGGPSITFLEGKLYRMNGFDGKQEQGGSIDIFDPESNTWDFISFTADGSSGPAPRSVGALHAVTKDNIPLLVTLFGEGDPSALGHAGAGKMFSDIWAFHVRQQLWSKVDATSDGGIAPFARGWFDSSMVDPSTIFVSGGLGEDNDRLSDCWLLSF